MRTFIHSSFLPALAGAFIAAAPATLLAADDIAPATPPAAAAPAAEKLPEKTPDKTPEEEARARVQKEVESFKLQLERLTVEYQLMQQKQRNELAKSELEKQELSTRSGLEQAKLDQELAALKAEVARIRAAAELDKARRDKEQAKVEVSLEEQALAAKIRNAELELELEKTKLEAQRLAAENSLRQEEVKKGQMTMQISRGAVEADLATLKADLDRRAARDQAAARVVAPVSYRANPLEGGKLYVSDRRISLNGPIGPGTADFVCDRIDFFNNRSTTDPIFIVIDSSPGGSVMEGYRIVNAIERSPAPVHVVVKSFAASMAAVITTLAPHSYTLPNAIILHHQMSSGMSGNLTQQKEQLENAQEWAKRLAEPVARKMGVGYDELVKRMYANNSDGDWKEFGDKAQQLKWVDHVITEVREEGLRDQPAGTRVSMPFWMEDMKEDDKGQPYLKLPPLMPFDFWAMYDPSDLWR